MNELLKFLSSSWGAILFVAIPLAAVLTWIVTRKVTQQMVSVYEKTIEAQEVLADKLANSNSKTIELLHAERKEVDERHEKAITDYREKLHKLRDDLQACTAQQAVFMAELSELRSRTDFKPVLKFQEAWYKESAEMNKLMVKTLGEVSTLLKRLVEGGSAMDVHVVNEPHDAIPAVIQPTPAA